MFAYCGNNPVNYYDPMGHQFGPTANHIKATYYRSPGERGTELRKLQMEAGNYAGQLVLDVSIAIPQNNFSYRKYGVSFIVDFERTEVNAYGHVGAGFGNNSGISASVGYASNYTVPDDYARDFVDINLGYMLGLDYCWNPYEDFSSATSAGAITFSPSLAFSGGIGYDFYLTPVEIYDW